MAVFLLIRHGENDWVTDMKLAGRLPDVHLNVRGQAQAERLAVVLADAPVKAVYSSPLERAFETAEPIAKAHSLPVQVHPDLIEIDFGKWAGKELRHLKQGRQWKLVQDSPAAFRFPDGESFAEAQDRIVKTLTELSVQYAEKEIVVCASHSDLIRLAVAHFLGMKLDNFQRIRIAPASLTSLYLSGGDAYFGPINMTFETAGFSL